MLIALTAVLFILIFIICGDKGTKSIVSTAMNAVLLLLAIFLIYRNFNPILVTIGMCVLITVVTLFYQNEVNIKSKVAFFSVLAVIVIMIPLVYLMAHGANGEGFSPENYEITDSNGYTRNIDVSMLSLQISIMFIALIGTVIDTAVAITSSIYEIRSNNLELPLPDLMKSSFTVSKAVMSIGNIEGEYNDLIVAPSSLKSKLMSLFDEEIAQGHNGKIVIKINSLTDFEIINKIKEASCAGVSVRMIVRGICCILPGIEGKTENLEIISIVGRFLEHSRVYCFGSGTKEVMYIGSADFMTRNTERRVEVACLIKDSDIKSKIDKMLDICFHVLASLYHPALIISAHLQYIIIQHPAICLHILVSHLAD